VSSQSLKEAERAKNAAAIEKQMKEFGRLSNKSDKSAQTTSTPGTMKTIGKLLIEVQAVENIIKTGETTGKIGSGLSTARIISAEKGEGIKALLSKIDQYENVVGSVIVGHDGLVMASTLPVGMDKDTLGNLSIACLGTSNITTRKLEIGKLLQMVMVTDLHITILTDVTVGILAVFMNGVAIDKIDGLIGQIQEIIYGC
jgi:predicted regulator of Ras-like GTPase activity (Roadblock/LC7/MglB family)